jgi:hypothetical protein
MNFIYLCENRAMKPVEIILSKGEGAGRMMVEMNSTISTYGNVSMKPST